MVRPTDTLGVRIFGSLPVFGRQDQHGHVWIEFENARVLANHTLATKGDGFMVPQARLGPGCIHRCMRSIGRAKRAPQMMVERANQDSIQEWIAESQIEIEQARLLTMKAVWMIDQGGAKMAKTEIAAIKVIAPRVACNVIDRAIQVHGGLGVSNDVPLAKMYGWQRALKLFDGPDHVHLRSIASWELKRPGSVQIPF